MESKLCYDELRPCIVVAWYTDVCYRCEETTEMDQAELTAQMNKNMTFMMPILSVSVSLVVSKS